MLTFNLSFGKNWLYYAKIKHKNCYSLDTFSMTVSLQVLGKEFQKKMELKGHDLIEVYLQKSSDCQ